MIYSTKPPLINIELLANQSYRLLLVLRLIFMIFMASSLFLIPLYMQNIIGYSSSKVGLTLLAMTLFVAVSSPITGKAMDKIGFITPVCLLIVLALLASILMMFYQAPEVSLILFPSLILFGLAIGVHTPSTINGVHKQAAADQAGTAMGLFFTAAITGATMGVALAGGIVDIMSRRFLLSHGIRTTQSLFMTLPQERRALNKSARFPCEIWHRKRSCMVIILV